MEDAVFYTVTPCDLAGHLFRVSMTLPAPSPDGQLFMLPAWIPGSYLIREFARNIVQIHASSAGKAVPLEKRDKHTWQAAPASEPLTLEYDVYAWDLSVRGAHLDKTHGFFNGSSLFLRAASLEHLPHRVEICPPADPACAGWRVATALPEESAPRHGFGIYRASGYDELIDHPVEMGTFALATFEAGGIPHEVAVTGRVPNLDMDRLVSDLSRICTAHIGFFEPVSKKPPMARYVFLVTAVGNGYGGLEHRASTALLCSRNDLPVLGRPLPEEPPAAPDEAYQNFLGLCSHEYFHAWNVKRIRPAAFSPCDLQNENYTRLLWLFEGFTSYYDDLMLVRSGLLDVNAYLRCISRAINNVKRGTGRKKQSVAESSFDAWIKFYRQDENATNAIVNYYTKGSLVALALDLTIRIRTNNERSLDDGMRLLWQRYGKPDQSGVQQGIGETEAVPLFEEAAGLDLKDFFRRYVDGTDELQLAHLLEHFGIRESSPPGKPKASLNVRLQRAGGDCRIAAVYEWGAAHAAGLAAGDILVAIDGLRVTGEKPDAAVEKLLSRYAPGHTVTIHAFRHDELMAFEAVLAPDDTPRHHLSLSADQTPAITLARQAWLTPETARELP